MSDNIQNSALPADVLIDALREVLNSPADAEAPVSGDNALNPELEVDQRLTPAAVLIPLVASAKGLDIVLTRRTDHLRDHAGQISFPGGRKEEHDTDLIQTALRETEEEIGIEQRFVEVVGELESYRTVTGFSVKPIVGLVKPGYSLVLDEFEVAEVFSIPFDLMLNPGSFQRHRRRIREKERSFYVVPYRHYYIWGATAGMLRNLCERLKPLWVAPG